MKTSRAIFFAFISLFFSVSSGGAQQELISIGTGSVTGGYYPSGAAICKMINQGRQDHGVRCSVESTGGSNYNIATIRDGELEFGFAQSDRQYDAYTGQARFAEFGPFEDLRSVFSLYPEPFTMLVGPEFASLDEVYDKGGRLVLPQSIPPFDNENFVQACNPCEEGCPDQDCKCHKDNCESRTLQANSCNGNLDALGFATRHPSSRVASALSCGMKLVDLSGPGIDQLLGEFPYYRTARISQGLYGDNEEITTFGFGATLVTSAHVSDEVVYQLVRSVFENFDQFRSLHPAFATLVPEEMIIEGLTAPLHEGAIRYYKERGWVN